MMMMMIIIIIIIMIIHEIPLKTRQLATLDNHSALADIHQRSLEEYTPVGKILESLTFSQSMGLHPMASEQKTKMPTENGTMSAYINVNNSLLYSSDFISTQSS
jgi:exoribonuclease R